MEVALVQCPSWTIESPPYSLALLAASLRKAGHRVTCFDLNIELYSFCKESGNKDSSVINCESWSMSARGHIWYEKESVLKFINTYGSYIDRVVKTILSVPARIIGFSVQSTSKFFSLEIARRIKDKDKERIIVFGGPLCFRNCYGIDILKDFLFLDLVCFGEGEKLFYQLVDNIEEKGLVEPCAGFGYRLKDGSVIDYGDSQFIEDLDSIPFADYHGFKIENYTKRLLPISTSRGCINRCTFCNESVHWQRYRRRSAQNILEEIKYQLENNPFIEWFWFNDSLINGDIKMLDELCDLLISNKISIRWGGQGMIRKEMTKDFLLKMKLSGCKVISYGVESGSNRILKLMRKGYTSELAERVMRDTFEIGIDVIFNIIICFPGETKNAFKETHDFVLRCKNFASHIELPLFLLLKDSFVHSNLDRFNIAPIGDIDSDWQLKWQTNDRQNTYDIRQKRLEELVRLTKL